MTDTTTLTAPAFVAAIAQTSGLNPGTVKVLLAALALVARDQLRADRAVKLPGLGRLKPVHRAARSGTSAFGAFSSPARRVATFTADKALRDAIAPLPQGD
jgi:nucleoid DNA-binding protein